MNSNDLTIEEVEHLANLANLKLSETDKASFQKELTSVVGYVSEVQKINLHNALPTAQVTGKVNEFREDVVTPSLSQSQAISQSKKAPYKGFFVVPQVIKG